MIMKGEENDEDDEDEEVDDGGRNNMEQRYQRRYTPERDAEDEEIRRS